MNKIGDKKIFEGAAAMRFVLECPTFSTPVGIWGTSSGTQVVSWVPWVTSGTFQMTSEHRGSIRGAPIGIWGAPSGILDALSSIRGALAGILRPKMATGAPQMTS